MSRSAFSFGGSRLVSAVPGCKPNRAAGMGYKIGCRRPAARPAGIKGADSSGSLLILDVPDPIIRAAALRSGPSGRRGGPGRGRTECRWPPRC